MEFTPESILLSLFTSLVTGVGSYFAVYVKGKAELRAATEGLKRYIANQAELTRAVETEKLKISTEGAIGTEARKCLYSLVAAVQSLLHSMCWLGWDTLQRSTTRAALMELYDAEAHKLQPEILAQQALLMRLDPPLYLRSRECIAELFRLDVGFGEAIVLSETDQHAAVESLTRLYYQALSLKEDVDTAFRGPEDGQT